MNELKKSLLISIPIAAACLYLGIYAHSVTLIIAGFVVAFVGLVIPAVSARVRKKGPFTADIVLAFGVVLVFMGSLFLSFLDLPLFSMLAFPPLIIGTIFVAAAMAKWVKGDA